MCLFIWLNEEWETEKKTVSIIFCVRRAVGRRQTKETVGQRIASGDNLLDSVWLRHHIPSGELGNADGRRRFGGTWRIRKPHSQLGSIRVGIDGRNRLPHARNRPLIQNIVANCVRDFAPVYVWEFRCRKVIRWCRTAAKPGNPKFVHNQRWKYLTIHVDFASLSWPEHRWKSQWLIVCARTHSCCRRRCELWVFFFSLFNSVLSLFVTRMERKFALFLHRARTRGIRDSNCWQFFTPL